MAMRQIVVGQLTKGQGGVQQVNVWFRFPVPAQRQAYYTTLQASFTPSAPGDYANADLAEINQFRTGQFFERPNFFDVVDPTSTLAQIKARLVNIYAAAATQVATDDTAALSRWATAYDGTVWADKSA